MSRPTQSWTPSPRLPVLIGVARAETDLVAVIEVPEQGKVIEYRPGDTLPGGAGVLGEITLDHIEIAAAEGIAPQKIQVGQDLKGATPAPTSGATTTASTSPSDAAATGSVEGDDLLSRMRRRRMQEMNR